MVNARLGVFLMLITVIALGLTVALVYTVLRPRPVYYISGSSLAGIAYPQTDPSATASIFAASWVLNWSNFTPATVDRVYQHAQQFMSPRLLNQTKTRLKKDIEHIKGNNISSMFSVEEDPLVEAVKGGYEVVLKGNKGIYMGKEEIRVRQIRYRLELRVIPPTDINPYGFIVEKISQEEL